MAKYSWIGDLTPVAKAVEEALTAELEKLTGVRFDEDTRPAFVISFTLPTEYQEVHWVGNLSRQDGARVLLETAQKMIAKTN
jgi:hypothetical protein